MFCVVTTKVNPSDNLLDSHGSCRVLVYVSIHGA